MMKKYFTGKKIAVPFLLSVFFIALYVFISIIKPSDILSSVFHYNINNPGRVNNLFFRQLLLLIFLSAGMLCFSLFYKSSFYNVFISFLGKIYNNVLDLLTVNILLIVTLLYLAVLFPLAIASYDLGYDEAVYLDYAKNFAHTAMVYITYDNKIVPIDTIAMLPYYIASLPNYWLNLTELWHFKLTSSLLSVLTLIALFKISKDRYGKAASILFIFFLALQPGFGFIASSYFGELLQAAFLLYGFSLCFGNEKDLLSQKKLIASSLFISLAIHTKFQLAFIVTFTLLALFISSRHKGILKLLGYTILFSAGLSFIRTIPVLIYDFSLLKGLILITDIFAGPAYASYSVILEKFQLFNRFFPLPLFLIICAAFYFYTNSLFERALFYFSVITVTWWIFLYPLSTYRNPFMGIITICLMAGVLSIKAYDYYINKYPVNKRAVKLLTVMSLSFLMVYGFSANLIYAYVGYNDGVQFDLDGFKNRLFSNIEHNTSQKDFYEGVKKIVNPADTIYNGSWVPRHYLSNPIFTFDALKESLQRSPGEKYVLVARDFYPLGFEKIYSKIDTLGVTRRLILKTGEHELYGVSK